MAQFRGTLQGNRGEVSRLGHKSGMTAKVNGWDRGIRVTSFYNETTKRDEFHVFLTGGSNFDVDIRCLYRSEEDNQSMRRPQYEAA